MGYYATVSEAIYHGTITRSTPKAHVNLGPNPLRHEINMHESTMSELICSSQEKLERIAHDMTCDYYDIQIQSLP